MIDGDTLVLESGETVRLIGIDTPETKHPEVPVQRFGVEASAFLRQMAEGFACRLEFDAERTDAYGRMLAYVFVDGKMVNEEMIRRGYAYAYPRFEFRHRERFMRTEAVARERGYGLWNLSLTDGATARLVEEYGSLNLKGREKMQAHLETLRQTHALSTAPDGAEPEEESPSPTQEPREPSR